MEKFQLATSGLPEKLVGGLKELKIEGKNAVITISVLGVLWLAAYAIQNGYELSITKTEDNLYKVEVTRSVKSKS